MSQGATSTIEENYRETVELVKKFIRVKVPNLQDTSLAQSDERPSLSRPNIDMIF